MVYLSTPRKHQLNVGSLNIPTTLGFLLGVLVSTNLASETNKTSPHHPQNPFKCPPPFHTHRRDVTLEKDIASAWGKRIFLCHGTDGYRCSLRGS